MYLSNAPINVKPQGGGGGAGYPREIDWACLPQGREFDMATILEDQEKLEMSDLPSL